MLLELALTDLFRARWSYMIHDEWTRHLLATRPDLNSAQLQRTRQLMDSHVRECLVEDFETLIPSLTLPDADDRHVLAPMCSTCHPVLSAEPSARYAPG